MGARTLKNLPHLKSYVASMGNEFHEERGKTVGPVSLRGRSKCKFFARQDNDDLESYDYCAQEYFPELQRNLNDGSTVRFYSSPGAGADDERGSMLYHASLWKDGQEIVPSERFVEVVASMYPKTKFKNPLRRFDEQFSAAVRSVQSTSSPGASYVLGATDGFIIENRLDLLRKIVYERLVLIASTPWKEFEQLSSTDLVEQGYCDFIRIFLKKEVVKWSKRFNKLTHKPLDHPRFRIISSVSLVDQLIHRMVYTTQNKAEIKNYTYLMSKPGVGFSSDYCVRAFAESDLYHESRRQMKSKDDPDYCDYRCLDFEAWDWTVKFWQMMLDCDIRRTLVDHDDDKLMAKCHFLVCNSVFCLSNGELWEQIIPGMMKSGWFNTSSTNSRIRSTTSLLFFGVLHWIIAMGDDSVEDDDPRIDAFCAWIDVVVGQTIPVGDRLKCEKGFVEFCSHQFHLSGTQVNARLLTWLRSLAKFCYSPKKSSEQIAGVLLACRHCDEDLERLQAYFRAEHGELYEEGLNILGQ